MSGSGLRGTVLIVVVLLAAGCGGTGSSPTTETRAGNAGTTTRCSATSDGFRSCTVFALTSAAFRRLGGGEVSRIEHRDGSRWSVVLAPEHAPYPGDGWWRRVLADQHGETLLAEWSGECEVPFTYLITTDTLQLRQVFPSHPVTVLGWTGDGLARVKLWEPIAASKGIVARSAGVYLVTPGGRPVHLERRLRRTHGC